MKSLRESRRLPARVVLLLLALVLMAASVAARPEQQSSNKTLYWEYYNVTMEVQTNGDIMITEVQQITFTSGTFTFGTATIPLDRTEGITDVRVSEATRVYEQSAGGGDYTFTASEDGNNLDVVWYFPPTANSTHTYQLRYLVHQAVRVPPILAGSTCGTDGPVVDWNAIPADHNFGINQAQVILALPAPVMSDAQGPFARTYGTDAQVVSSDGGRSLTFTSGYIPAQQGMEICAVMPQGTITGGQPAWQAAEAAQQQRDAVIGSAALICAIPLLLFGLLGMLALYYTRGRDPEVGLVAEYLSEPPSNLPPGVAGTLIDEHADLQDILSTLVDLARRGKLDMQEQKSQGWGMGADFVFRRTSADLSDLRPYERVLLDKVFGGGSERRLSELRQKFYVAIPGLKEMLYDEVVKEGFFRRSPESVRSTYRVAGGLLLGAAFVGGIVAMSLVNSGSVICPFASAGLVGLVMLFVAGAMPARTRKGAEESAKWAAFKRYLQNTEKYTDLAAAKDQFERYLPYAIAFGLERTWISRFARVPDMPVPTWYYPWGIPYGSYGRGGMSLGTPAAQGGMPQVAGAGQAPSLGNLSDRMAGGLQSMSSGLLTMLNTAGTTFVSVPPSQSGGGSFRGGGGGFHGGGGGGGGGRGFG